MLCVVAAALHLVGNLQAHLFRFKAGATFEGEVAEFKGTMAVVVTSAKDGKSYSLVISTLSETDQEYVAGLRREMQSRITGAFGLQLGQRFLLGFATSKSESGAGDPPQYGFRPQDPLPSFSEYRVCVTPHSNHIFYIVAVGHLNWEKAYEERRKIVSALEEKYGKSVHRKRELDVEYDTITIGNRAVEVRFLAGSGLNDPTLIALSYEDKALRKQAEKESGGEERDSLKKRL